MINNSAQKLLNTVKTVSITDNERSNFYIEKKDHKKYL